MERPPAEKTLFQSLSDINDFKVWVRRLNTLMLLGLVASATQASVISRRVLQVNNNKLQALGSAWVSAVGISLASQWRHNTPVSLKFFQTRIYAQAFTVAAMCAAAALTIGDSVEDKRVSDEILPTNRH